MLGDAVPFAKESAYMYKISLNSKKKVVHIPDFLRVEYACDYIRTRYTNRKKNLFISRTQASKCSHAYVTRCLSAVLLSPPYSCTYKVDLNAQKRCWSGLVLNNSFGGALSSIFCDYGATSVLGRPTRPDIFLRKSVTFRSTKCYARTPSSLIIFLS